MQSVYSTYSAYKVQTRNNLIETIKIIKDISKY